MNSSNSSAPPAQPFKPSPFTSQPPATTKNPFTSFAKPSDTKNDANPLTPTPTPSLSFETKPKVEDKGQAGAPSIFSSTPASGPQGQQSNAKSVLGSESVFATNQTGASDSKSSFASFKPATPSNVPSAAAQNDTPKVQNEAPKFSFASQPGPQSSSAVKSEVSGQQSLPTSGLFAPVDTGSSSITSAIPSQTAPSPFANNAPPASTPAPTALGNTAQGTSQFSQPNSGGANGLLPAQSISTTKAPARELGPPRDPMGDFSHWFLLGDQGLLDEFKAYIVEDMLSKVYDSFYAEQEEKRRQEEEALLIAEADAFRAYNLSMKYFYRWKELAREKRLRTVRRQARDQAREFYEQQRAAEREARRKTAARVNKEKAHVASLDRPEEFLHMLQNKKSHRRQAEEALLASGILSGVANEREVATDIVRREISPSIDGSVGDRPGMRSRSGSGTSSTARGGSKTRALREELLGGSSASFRRSLPPMSASARSSAEPDGSNRKSKVSERWRLKAMGITQMPDGTAMPESLANEILYGGKQYKELGSLGLGASKTLSRRASIGDSGLADSFAMPPPRSTPATRPNYEAGSPTKRKRTEEDEENERRRSGIEAQRGNSHKRIMSGAEQVISELKALRMEMEEGSAWFREQNERLQSEGLSRGSTPWEGSIT
ncbi:hypothetical protein CC79DRAFT_1364429 [Sarocladium strictum]